MTVIRQGCTCEGCNYCQQLHKQWERFEDEVDDVVPLTVRQVTEDPDRDPEIEDDLRLIADDYDLRSNTRPIEEDDTNGPITSGCNWIESLQVEDLREAQMADEDIGTILTWKEIDHTPSEGELMLSSPAVKHWWLCKSQLELKDGVLFYRWEKDNQPRHLLLVPKCFQEEVLAGCHDAKLASHMGQQKTIERVKCKYIWHGYQSDCIRYVKSCNICNCNKRANIQARAQLGEYHAGVTMERVHIDILGPFVLSSWGNKYILMIIDQFAKWLEC